MVYAKIYFTDKLFVKKTQRLSLNVNNKYVDSCTKIQILTKDILPRGAALPSPEDEDVRLSVS